jgi:hypothetical protein
MILIERKSRGRKNYYIIGYQSEKEDNKNKNPDDGQGIPGGHRKAKFQMERA